MLGKKNKDKNIIYKKEDILKDVADEFANKEPVRRGCPAAEQGGCFCSGACQEIIGWRDKPSPFGTLINGNK